ncbi:hypothetical protein RPSD_52650 (plasmid) [Ralstonia solanacearum]|nr:hypothetical protein RPSD_52650 [Ralstonia solanacearum]
MTNITTRRELAGMRIEGSRYAVRLHPASEWQHDGDPSVSVSVHALPVDGEDRGIDLTYDTEHVFALTDIALAATEGGTELRCLRATAARSGAPAFREGFVLALEPGMADAIAEALPHIDRVTQGAAQICSALAPHLGRRLWPHENDAVLEVMANLAQYCGVDSALHAAHTLLGEPMFRADSRDSYAELGAALRQTDVNLVLERLIGDLSLPPAANAVRP